MNIVDLNQTVVCLASRAVRKLEQKDISALTDRIMRKGAELEAMILALPGTREEIDASLAALDTALDEACWSIVPIDWKD